MRALWSTTARLFRRTGCDDRTSRSDWKSSPGYRIRLAGPNARLCRSGSCRHVARESDLRQRRTGRRQRFYLRRKPAAVTASA
jgi:hypothetical protein